MIESTSNSFKGFFWKIEDAKGNKGYVLGSIHMGSDDLLEINPKIMKCFFKSQSLAVEVNNEGEILNFRNKIQLSVFKELAGKLEAERVAVLADRMLQVSQALGVNIESKEDKVATISEGMLALSNIVFQQNAIINASEGMETKLLSLAQARSIPVYDLEEVTTLVNKDEKNIIKLAEDIFNIVPSIGEFRPSDYDKVKQGTDAVKAAAHEEFLVNKAKYAAIGLFESWREGNLDYFEAWNQRELEPGSPHSHLPQMLSRLHHDRIARNVEMKNSIIKLISEGKRPFAVVGTRHVVGVGFEDRPREYSVLDYLQGAGLTVTRL